MNKTVTILSGLMAAVIIVGCSNVKEKDYSHLDYYQDGKFQNEHKDTEKSKFFSAMWAMMFESDPRAEPLVEIPVKAITLEGLEFDKKMKN